MENNLVNPPLGFGAWPEFAEPAQSSSLSAQDELATI
jgi:hypothetical protein